MINKTTLALGAAFAASMSLSIPTMASEAQFGATPLQTGYNLAATEAEGKCGADKMKKGEGKCGANMKKEGEGKCGADVKKDGEGKCGADVKKDAPK